VMLSGVFWLGEICMTRLTLTHGERLRLWEKGTRHSSNSIEADDVFRFLPRVASGDPRLEWVTGYSNFNNNFKGTDNEAYGWGTIVSGHADVTTRRSEWSWGIDDFVRRSLLADADVQSLDTPGSGAERMFARTDPFDNPLDSLMLFRRKDNSREGKISYQASSTKGSNEWNKIYLGEWGDFIKPSKISDPSGPVDPYTRNSYYVRWSE